MSHPDALLAEYVDGALAEGERAAVERHLASCERCRDEVALARAARAALASVPETPAPSDLGAAAIAEARRRAGSHPAAGAPPGRPAWYRWAGAAAGIAAALLVVALILPHVGNAPATTAAGGGWGAARGPIPRHLRRDTERQLRPVGRRVARNLLPRPGGSGLRI